MQRFITASLLFVTAVVVAQNTCHSELKKACPFTHTPHNQTSCRVCVREELKKLAACTTVDEIDYCEPASCAEALDLLCHDDKSNSTKCDECVRSELKALEKFDCDASDARAFCAQPGPPAPSPSSCSSELGKLCGDVRSDHAKCIDCELHFVDELTRAKCAAGDLIAYCKVGPQPGPPGTCEAELKKVCGSVQKDVTKCDDCVFNNVASLVKAGCSGADDEKFCDGK